MTEVNTDKEKPNIFTTFAFDSLQEDAVVF